MIKKKEKENPEVNSGSMADIAFLLLIFFLVTTTIASDKGVAVMLPPKAEQQDDVKVKERNVFNILINSQDGILANDEVLTVEQLREKVREFVLNNGKDANLSVSPDKAIVSIKTDRGSSYEIYIKIRDMLNFTYDEMRAQYLKVPLEDYMEWLGDMETHGSKVKDAKKAIPKMISDAEPTKIGG